MSLHINHETNSPRAAGYRAAQEKMRRMMERAAGNEVVQPAREHHAHNSSNERPLISAPAQYAVPAAQSVVSENTVTIENSNIPFEISYPFDTSVMSVGMSALSIDTSEDSISILITDTIKLKLPKLEPLKLIVNSAPYKVCWAGGMHRFGKFKHISFVIIE